MRLLVGPVEGGGFFAYDVSTLDKLKKAYMDLIKHSYCMQKIYLQKPSFLEEDIDNLPKELRGLARVQYSDYRWRLKQQEDNEKTQDKIQQMMKAKTEEEFLDLAYEISCETEIHLRDDYKYDFVELKEL